MLSAAPTVGHTPLREAQETGDELGMELGTLGFQLLEKPLQLPIRAMVPGGTHQREQIVRATMLAVRDAFEHVAIVGQQRLDGGATELAVAVVVRLIVG